MKYKIILMVIIVIFSSTCGNYEEDFGSILHIIMYSTNQVMEDNKAKIIKFLKIFSR